MLAAHFRRRTSHLRYLREEEVKGGATLLRQRVRTSTYGLSIYNAPHLTQHYFIAFRERHAHTTHHTPHATHHTTVCVV